MKSKMARAQSVDEKRKLADEWIAKKKIFEGRLKIGEMKGWGADGEICSATWMIAPKPMNVCVKTAREDAEEELQQVSHFCLL
ncbi:hypothetical protein L596_007904 [Steinernema carpocapsae]|uniref:Uncharacterized protein n=1 Tax=Steinernema carpocapsae TaxID=34508 RepID=A0A4U5PAX1_STECR|nr:hypothetical protein L596_007904 [Steinernema carpocapsae]